MRPCRGPTALRGAGVQSIHRGLAAAGAALLASACGGSPEVSPEDTPRLYVTSGLPDEVRVLDARDGTLLRTVSVDRRGGETDEPHGVTVSPDGRH